MINKKLNCAIAGLGKMGLMYYSIVKKLKINLVGIYDARDDNRKFLMKKDRKKFTNNSNDFFREKIDFQGIIFSDDLSMKGTDSAGSVLQKVKQAIDAGCNILLICNDRLATLEALNYMKANYIESKENLLTFETSHSISWNSLQHNDRRIRAEIIANNILKNNL